MDVRAEADAQVHEHDHARIARPDGADVAQMRHDGEVNPPMDGADHKSASPIGQLPREPLEAPRTHPEHVSRGLLALAGVIAGAAGLALSQAAAMALRAESSPVEAVGSAVRDYTPGPLAVF